MQNSTISEKFIEILKLDTLPVGVKFFEDEIDSNEIEEIECRFCQAVMFARKGNAVIVNKQNITCPAAASALGLKSLPEQLKNGTMLKGYGIFHDTEIGKKVMETMPRIEQGIFQSILVKPLKDFNDSPDVVITEDEVEKLMWVGLAYLNDFGGRLDFSTSVLQAVCVDACVIPFLQNKLNLSFGCYGCRDATDVKSGEAVLGFPYNKTQNILDNLSLLDNQAIERSRAKNVFHSFTNRLGDN